ncbi:TPA: hypothetical protein PTW11_002827 [Cronobacter sakazakii]|nr:hypothetical protein [Cronobacter sakazakii]ELY4201605.1 hypothetical protein [Cronobacter sakazakii]ELY4857588.1 hypothetical protein [Cronobacter sakazakii]HDK7244948.1 hypothetical protein [Cronobacter sakazakii]HDK7285562.1 hypothetical protein [Cronobacter sakazakii]
MCEHVSGVLTADDEQKLSRLFSILENPTYKTRSNPSDLETQRKARLLLNRGFSPQVIANTLEVPFAEVWRLTRQKQAVTWAMMPATTRTEFIREMWVSRMHPEQIRKRCDGLSYVSLRYYLHNAGITDAEMLGYFPDVFADICKLPTLKKKRKRRKAR